MPNTYRIRMSYSSSTAQLRGVSATPTDGLAIDGVYNSSLDMHEFVVSVSGVYTLWEDVNGGSSYIRRTDWSDSSGKYIRGNDLVEDARQLHDVRYRKGYSGIQELFKDAGASFKSGIFIGQQDVTESEDVTDANLIEPETGTRTLFPPTHKIDRTKTSSDGSGYAIIKINSKTDIVIDGGELDGNAANNGYYTEHDHGISIVNSSRITIRNLWIHDHSGDGIYISNSDDILIENCIIDVPNVNASGPLVGRNGIAVVEGARIKIRNCYIRGGIPGGIDLETNGGDHVIEDVQIIGCTIESNAGYGISVNSANTVAGTTTTIKNILIANNTIINTYENAIDIMGAASAGNAYTYRVKVLNNTIIDCLDSGAVRPGAVEIRGSATYIDIRGNTIKGSGKCGIIAQCHAAGLFRIVDNWVYNSQQHGIWLSNTSGNEENLNEVRGNRCEDNGQSAANTYDGVYVQYSDYLLLSDNFCNGSQQRYGVQVVNSDYVTFGAIKAHNNATAAFRIASSTHLDFPTAKQILTATYPSLAANQSWTGMMPDGSTVNSIVVPFDGYIIAVGVKASANVTAGSLTVRGEKNLSPTTTNSVTLNTSNPLTNYGYSLDPPKQVTAGERVNLAIMSDAALLPAGSLNIIANVWMI